MRYLLILHGEEQPQGAMSPADRERVFAAFREYTEAMHAAGVRRGGEALLPSGRGAKVQTRAGRTSVVDGPFTEAREVVGGYYLIEVASREEALAWATRCPSAHFGTVEVREVLDLDYNRNMSHA